MSLSVKDSIALALVAAGYAPAFAAELAAEVAAKYPGRPISPAEATLILQDVAALVDELGHTYDGS